MIVRIIDGNNIVELTERGPRGHVRAYRKNNPEGTTMEREFEWDTMHYFTSLMYDARSIMSGVEGQLERLTNSSVKPT